LRILIIDDEEIICNTLNDIFDFMGHTATCVDNGFYGLKEIENSDYDAAFVDIKMPGMDGIDFLQRMKEMSTAKPVPVFIMTGHGDENTRDEAIIAGASGFLCKPFGYTELQEITDKIMESEYSGP